MNRKTARPEVVRDLASLRGVLDEVAGRGARIGLVPTMGFLHEGHLSLVRRSTDECDYTVVTIYVNPSQFGPAEDLAEYPRAFEADLGALAGLGVPLVFAPRDEEIYPSGYSTWIEVGSVAEPLEGECRLGHFRGVATIVLKLFNMVRADVAYFGEKDYQQARVIRRMVDDLNVPIEVRLCPIVREPDGLAMSSRNAYLSADARRRALVLYGSLCLAEKQVAQGERDAQAIVGRMREMILAEAGAKIDYVALADPESLLPVAEITGPTVALLAVWIDRTRLIDNRLLVPPGS